MNNSESNRDVTSARIRFLEDALKAAQAEKKKAEESAEDYYERMMAAREDKVKFQGIAEQHHVALLATASEIERLTEQFDDAQNEIAELEADLVTARDEKTWFEELANGHARTIDNLMSQVADQKNIARSWKALATERKETEESGLLDRLERLELSVRTLAARVK